MAGKPDKAPRFPYVGALLCAACLGAAAWTWLTADKPTAAVARHEQGYSAWALSASTETAVEKLKIEAKKHDCSQRVDGDFVLWLGEDGRVEAMFCVIPDPRTPTTFRKVYDKIAATGAPLTYVFVRQPPAGRGDWDVFRMSRQFSYLAHCWRFCGRDALPEPGEVEPGGETF